MNKSLADWAIYYQSKGLSVIPLGNLNGNAGKEPLISHKDQPPLTAEQIKHYWGQKPDLNIGIKTTQLFTVDFDVPPHHKNDGFKSWNEHAELKKLLIPTLSFTTGTGGKQYVYFKPGKRQVKSRTSWLPGVDIRGDDNHYFMAPPSVNLKTGGLYEWDEPHQKIVTAPLGLVDLINGRQHYQQQSGFIETDYRKLRPVGKTRVGQFLDEMALGVVEGGRNSFLTSQVGYMLSQGAEPETALYWLKMANLNCEPPLPEQELMTIFNSILKREVQKHGST